MHPRNPYKASTPDFRALAAAYPALAPFLIAWGPGEGARTQTCTLQWSDPRATLELTRALLHRDFGITFDLPADRLCPTITSRLNYLLLAEDLAAASGPGSAGSPARPEGSAVLRGLDVGTGASCIYALLGAARGRWTFVATDADAVALESARANVRANSLEAAIEVRDVRAGPGRGPGQGPGQGPDEGGAGEEGARLLEGVLREGEAFDCTLCNPPFYATDAEADAAPGPHRRRAAARAELVTPGGEVGFVGRLARESARLGGKARWYTSLVGRKASLAPLAFELSRPPEGCDRPRALLVAPIAQGQTWRWALAWSFVEAGSAPGWKPAAAELADASRPRKGPRALPRSREREVSCRAQAPGLTCGEALRRAIAALEREGGIPLERRGQDGSDAISARPQVLAFRLHDADGMEHEEDGHSALLELRVTEVVASPGAVLLRIRASAENDVHPSAWARVVPLLHRLRGDVARTNRRWRRSDKNHQRT